MTNKLMMAAAAVMLACSAMAFGANAGSVTCSASITDNCEIIQGPATLELKGVLEAGVGICHDETGDPIEEDIPLFCGEETGPSGAGAADFPQAAPAWGATRALSIQSEWKDPPGGCTDDFCGYKLAGCNDRDHDNICTNVLADEDQLFDAYSNAGLDLSDDDPNTWDDGNKDKKDALGFRDAYMEFCANQPVDTVWQADDIIVFVGNWIGVIGPNGLGIGAGTFHIQMTDHGADCTGFVAQENQPFICKGFWRVGSDGSRLPGSGGFCLGGGACGAPLNVLPGPADLTYPKTVTITCTANEACKPIMVGTYANLILPNPNPPAPPPVVPASSVSATIKCAGAVIVGSTDMVPDLIPVQGWGTKTAGTYECVMDFVVNSLPYWGEAHCRDKVLGL